MLGITRLQMFGHWNCKLAKAALKKCMQCGYIPEMRKLGFGFASIGMLMLVLLTGVEPVDEVAFWIHAGMMWIGVMVLGLGAVLMHNK